jgi:RNA binding exosome subunit
VRPVNNIRFRVFCFPEEDRGEIRGAFLALLGCTQQELEDQKILLKETNAKGFSQRVIVIFEAVLERERHCNAFLKQFREKLSVEDRALLLAQQNRLDDNMNFYVRLHKDALLDGRYALTDSGNCFHLSMNINAHPRKREAAWKVLEQVFGEN